eukprot:5993762-Alexandrium_andersonii.AAC.1
MEKAGSLVQQLRSQMEEHEKTMLLVCHRPGRQITPFRGLFPCAQTEPGPCLSRVDSKYGRWRRHPRGIKDRKTVVSYKH